MLQDKKTDVGKTDNVLIRTFSSDITDEDDAKVEFLAPRLLDDDHDDVFQFFCSTLENASHTIKIIRKRKNGLVETG